MEERARKTILYVLKAIKYKADISPDETEKLAKIRREILKRVEEEEAGLVESTERYRNRFFDLFEGKHIKLFQNDLTDCDLPFNEYGLGEILKKLTQENLLNDFRFKEDIIKSDRYEIILPENFNLLYKSYISKLGTPGISEDKRRGYQIEALKNKLEEGLKEERMEERTVEKVVRKIQAEKEGRKQSTDNLLSIQLKKCKLIIHKNTGNVSLSKVKTNLNPETQEFKILLKLAMNGDHIATYKDLLGDNPTKTNKRNLSFIIRNIKEALGILPKKDAPNEDVIKNIKNHGYRLIT